MKKTLCSLLSFLIIISMFTGCSASQQENDTKSTQQTLTEVIEAVYPVDTQVDFHTDKQDAFITKTSLSTPLSINGKKEKSKPEAIQFEWVYNGEQSADTEYILNISESEDMSNAISYTTSSESLSVYNLKIATTYYWTISADHNTSVVSKFTTDAAPPRNLNVDGVTNVRDLGGRKTENGKITKQGLIFRCGRLNESSAETPNIEITQKGIKTMRDELGIKSEIDLRKTNDGEVGGITSSPLGTDINYYSCPMEWEGDTFNGNKEEILKVFEILSNGENYPLIFHCNIGTDRTGMIAFLVNALLGVTEEDLLKDYVFSNFANIGGTRKAKKLKDSAYYKAVQSSDGNSLSEKTYNCLVDFGVPSSQLDTIISILSED